MEDGNEEGDEGLSMDDLISRQAALEAIDAKCKRYFNSIGIFDYDYNKADEQSKWISDGAGMAVDAILDLPSAEPTLYGYQIEHLALIARVMAKEGVTPEKAVETFGNISKIVQIIVEEQREIIRKAVEEWGT